MKKLGSLFGMVLVAEGALVVFSRLPPVSWSEGDCEVFRPVDSDGGDSMSPMNDRSRNRDKSGR